MALRPSCDDVFVCIFCSFKGRNALSLRKHFSQDHCRNMFFWCKFCGKAYDCVDEFFCHLEKEVCNALFTHPCGFEGCDYSVEYPVNFIGHLKDVHHGQPLMPCKYCRRPFSMHWCLILHIQSECCNRPIPNLTKNPAVECCDRPMPKLTSNPVVEVPETNTLENSPSSCCNMPMPNLAESPAFEVPETKTLGNSQSSSLNQTKQNDISSLPEKEEDASNTASISKTSVSKSGKRDCKTTSKKRKVPNAWKKIQKRPFETEHSDSDPDDPTWNPNESDEDALKRKTSRMLEVDSTSDNLKEGSRSIKRSKICDNMKKCSTFKSWEDWNQKLSAYKSQVAIMKLLQSENALHFFKCFEMFCSFSSDSRTEFVSHILNSNHDRTCLYCFSCFETVDDLAKHMVAKHSRRCWQCSACLYRSCSKAHFKCHKNTAHGGNANAIKCKRLEINEHDLSLPGSNDEDVERKKYYCGMTGCDFTTLITDCFLSHFLEKHPDTQRYLCTYCNDHIPDVTLDLFVKHFRDHKIYVFECYLCDFGSDKSDDVLMHMCLNHPDSKINILCRRFDKEIRNDSLKSNSSSIAESVNGEDIKKKDEFMHANSTTVIKNGNCGNVEGGYLESSTDSVTRSGHVGSTEIANGSLQDDSLPINENTDTEKIRRELDSQEKIFPLSEALPSSNSYKSDICASVTDKVQPCFPSNDSDGKCLSNKSANLEKFECVTNSPQLPQKFQSSKCDERPKILDCENIFHKTPGNGVDSTSMPDGSNEMTTAFVHSKEDGILSRYGMQPKPLDLQNVYFVPRNSLDVRISSTDFPKLFPYDVTIAIPDIRKVFF